MTYTPWGKAQNVINHMPGVKTVSTATHGGIMISSSFAIKHMSKAAIKLSEKYNDYFCYEEDAEWMIPTFELNSTQRRAILQSDKFAQMSDQEIENYLIEQLSGTNPDYLLLRGYKPYGELYEIHKMRIAVDKARLAKDPDLITTTRGYCQTLMHGVSLVNTADHKQHFVSTESVEKQKDLGPFLRLSECDVVLFDIDANSSDIPALKDRLIKFTVDLSNVFLEKINNNPELGERELGGGYYGFRARYNGTIESARSEFLKQYIKEFGVSMTDAIQAFNECINMAFNSVSTEFYNCRIFTEAKELNTPR